MTLRYEGPKRNWTFEQYVAGYLHVHNELDYRDEPISESKKVKDFPDGTEDDRLENAKDNIMSDEERLNNFDMMQKYISLVASNMQVASSPT